MEPGSNTGFGGGVKLPSFQPITSNEFCDWLPAELGFHRSWSPLWINLFWRSCRRCLGLLVVGGVDTSCQLEVSWFHFSTTDAFGTWVITKLFVCWLTSSDFVKVIGFGPRELSMRMTVVCSSCGRVTPWPSRASRGSRISRSIPLYVWWFFWLMRP